MNPLLVLTLAGQLAQGATVPSADADRPVPGIYAPPVPAGKVADGKKAAPVKPDADGKTTHGTAFPERQPYGPHGFDFPPRIAGPDYAASRPDQIAAAPVTGEHRPDQVIFLVRAGADPQALAHRANVNLVQTVWLQSLPLAMATARLIPGDTPAAAIGRLQRLTGVAWAQPNHLYRAQGQMRALPPGYGLENLNDSVLAAPAHGVVAMIDTPAALGHEALLGARIEQRVFAPDAAPGAHGTAVAALIAGRGNPPGTGWGARLVILAAFPGGSGEGPAIGETRYLAQAFDAAVQLRPNVLNLSFGGPEDRLLAALLDAAAAKGICIAAAAGNGGQMGLPPFPATHPGVLGVTAVDEGLHIYPQATPGPQVAVAALGVDLIAATPGGYRQVSGTSFAAALVSGALARTPSCAQARDPQAMRTAVKAAARDLGAPGRDAVFGAGLFRLPGGR